MKRQLYISLAAITLCFLLPLSARAQASDMQSLHQVLDGLYEEMLPLCERLIGIGRGLAGFAALWYIASRVWRHMANAEPVDFYPLLRPFALGMAILLFPSVLALMNGILQPTVTATAAMVEDSDKAIALLLKKKEEAIRETDAWQMYVGVDGNGDREKWYQYTHPDEAAGEGEGVVESIGNDVKFAMAKASYNFRHSIKQWMSEVLQLLFQAASLCINTIRTFYLVVLAVLGPLVFGFAVFDGLQHTLTVWIARYVNVYLWLPVANIFGSIIGKIQENMLRLDISQVEGSGDTFFSATDTAYLAFLLIGIVGYFTVPGVANYIVHAGGSNSLLFKVTNLAHSTSRSALSQTKAGAGYVAGALGSGGALFYSYRQVQAAQQRIYVLANGKALEALASGRRENIPVEARDHVRTFHHYFFTLDPDDKVIEAQMARALYLADGSARRAYDNLRENGYFSSLISANVSQEITVDSVQVDTQSYPYYFRYYGRQKLIRATSVLTRSLVTEGWLRSVLRSDNNPHGFLIERWTTLENKDLHTQAR